MADRPIVRLEIILYVLIFVMAGILRFGNLGWLPLSDAEAIPALAAASATPSAPQIGLAPGSETPDSAAYFVGTSFLFSAFGANETTARLFPALAGMLLLLVPWLLRSTIGPGAALTSAFLIAISPTMVTLARTAGGASLAVSGLGLALAAFLALMQTPETKSLRWILGLSLGLAICAGPQFFTGVIAWGIAWLLVWYLRRYATDGSHPDAAGFNAFSGWQDRRSALRESSLIALGGAFLLATGFGLRPEGLVGFFESLGQWAVGGDSGVRLPLLTYLLLLPSYEMLVLGFGLIGAIGVWRRSPWIVQPLLAMAAMGWLLPMLLAGRSAESLAWSVLPLTFLASIVLAHLVERLTRPRSWEIFLLFSSILIVLCVFSLLQLSAYAQGIGPELAQLNGGIRAVLAFGSLLFIVAAIVLFGLGWSWAAALDAAGIAAFVALLALSTAAGWRLNFSPGAAGGNELWRPRMSTLGLPLVIEVLESISLAQTGQKDALPILTLDPTPPALAWGLRGFEPASDLASAAEPAPPIVLARADRLDPGLQSEYLGQGTVIAENWGWDGPLPSNVLQWWIRRQAPAIPELWVLYVRADLTGFELPAEDTPETLQ